MICQKNNSMQKIKKSCSKMSIGPIWPKNNYSTTLSKAWLNCGKIQTKTKFCFWIFGHSGIKMNGGSHQVSIIDNYHLPHHTLPKQPGVHIGNHSILKKKSNEQEN